MAAPNEPHTLLTLPAELRNTIYTYVFPPHTDILAIPTAATSPSALHQALDLNNSHFHRLDTTFPNRTLQPRPSSLLAPLLTSRQVHDEARFIALNSTPLYISSNFAHPEIFAHRSHCVPPAKLQAIRHITLSAKLQDLRALNETWLSIPFGSDNLRLQTLTIIPQRPTSSNTWAYAEVADLSQSHTLAYIIAETLKGLRNVEEFTVFNDGGFGDVVWKSVYRSLVFRLFRWGGVKCGIRVEEGRGADEMWFRAYLDADRGCEVGEELCRLIGKKPGDNLDEP